MEKGEARELEAAVLQSPRETALADMGGKS